MCLGSDCQAHPSGAGFRAFFFFFSKVDCLSHYQSHHPSGPTFLRAAARNRAGNVFLLEVLGFPPPALLRVVQGLMLSLPCDLPVVGGPAAPFETNLQLHLGLSSL